MQRRSCSSVRCGSKNESRSKSGEAVKRKVCVVTGTRAEYGLLYPVMKAIQAQPKLELLLVVTGMHLVERHGMTIREIEKDGFHVDERVEMSVEKDTGAGMADAIGIGIRGMAQAFSRLQPDMILVLGDRIEALAAAITAAYMNIVVTHIHGGDSAKAGLDESARHGITKFAHVHFAATRKSAERLLKMGEDKWRIFQVGAPGLDTILSTKLFSRKELADELDWPTISQKPYVFVLQHPVTTDVANAGKQMRETLEAVKATSMNGIVIYPNYDAGGTAMINVIQEYARLPQFRCFKNLNHHTYLSLMKHAAVMVGNSSSGIIESSSFRLPVVNIGIRQEGRERSTNIIDVPHDRKKIVRAVKQAMSQPFKKIVQKAKNPYGNGTAGKRIAAVLATIDINKRLIQKKLTY